MIIVSQDRKRMVNYNNVCRMDVTEWANDTITIDCFDTTGSELLLGEYADEERAKEVLKEITNQYKATEAFKACANRIADKVSAIAIEKGFAYEMPLE